jgi:hypothetical protein
MEGATGAEDCRPGLQSIPGQQKLMNLDGTLLSSGEVNPGHLAAATPPPFVCWPLSCCPQIPHIAANSEPSASSFLENTSWPGLATAAPVHSTCLRGRGVGAFFIHLAAMPRPVSCQLVTRFWLSLGRSSTASLFSTVLFGATLDAIRAR